MRFLYFILLGHPYKLWVNCYNTHTAFDAKIVLQNSRTNHEFLRASTEGHVVYLLIS